MSQTLTVVSLAPGGGADAPHHPNLRPNAPSLSSISEAPVSRLSNGGEGRPTTRTDPAGQEERTGGGAAAGPPLSGAAIALTMGPLCLAALLAALDLTIVATAVPAMVADLRAASAGYTWIGGAFILGHAAVAPVWAAVADLWGRRPVILTTLVVFLTGSLACALAPALGALIAGRAVQGVGAAGLTVMINTIICDLFSLRERGLYLAITSLVWALGSAVGPVLGGVFTTRLDWRWCFWINLPIGAAVFVALFFFLRVPSPHTPVKAGLKAVDWTGSALCIGGALMVLLGLDLGDVAAPWSSATVVSLLVFGALALGLFVLNEWKVARYPLVPLRLLSSPAKAAAYAVFALNAFVFIGLTYYLPLYSQAVLGADALASGLHLLPLIVSCSLAAAAAGVIIQRTGRYRPLMFVAQALLTLGAGLFIQLGPEPSPKRLFAFQVLAGVGAGLNLEAPLLAAQAAVMVRDTAAVIATMGFLRAITTAVSVVVGGVIFQNTMAAGAPALAALLGPQTAGLFDGDHAASNIELIGTLPGDQQGPVRHAYFAALRNVWILYVAIAGLASVLNLFVATHPLSTERRAAVLGIQRESLETSSPDSNPVHLATIEPSSTQRALRHRGTC